MTEAIFQRSLKKELNRLFPGCLIMKNDATDIQGIPDLTVLYKKKWAMLECKISENAKHQPNQDYYVNWLGEIGFARFIYPENRFEVMEELRRYFEE